MRIPFSRFFRKKKGQADCYNVLDLKLLGSMFMAVEFDCKNFNKFCKDCGMVKWKTRDTVYAIDFRQRTVFYMKVNKHGKPYIL